MKNNGYDDNFFMDDPVEIPIEPEIDLHTFNPKDVKDVVEEYLYQCHVRGFQEVRIIHGKGQQVLRRIVNSVLEKSIFVQFYSIATPESGSHGATIVRLRYKATEH
ncbi:MAG: hypothetical protein A2161_15645 [Candidatus Schekmanbacteria bacterium RBG_13_48_7]|uniref:Smr domain-containing protein n=1 Tax=Candidatus Schekmanbacteria bacterium RBG_13_48_7 TaxID=1817878 RepID=A0A1F7RKF9_9BACT|nr:MAG: hypothetical protein A2161_15645 [Candidatus Schekmanbacteria bacterium RBG_13_48_7]